MSKSIFTQRVLAETLKSLLLEKPFCKISIQEISTKCGITRNAYYYYYKDKYELLHWIVDYELKEIVKIYNSDLKITDIYSSIFDHIYNNKKFYYAALDYKNQNSLYEYFSNLFFDLCYEKLKEECIRQNILPSSVPINIYTWMIASSMVESLRTWHSDLLNAEYKTFIVPVNQYIEQVFDMAIKSHQKEKS